MSNNPNAAVIDAALTSVSRLATLPTIAARVLALVNDPEATADDLERLIGTDPVLSARMMKVVNSAFYRRKATIASIRQAVVVLGLSAVRNVALAASLGRMFRGKSLAGQFDPRALWQHSLAVAAAARLICERLDGDVEELFLVGLLHDVGTVIQFQAMGPKFADLIASRRLESDESYRDAELRLLGVQHDQLGLALCRKWNFPESIQAGVGYHHAPEALDGSMRRVAQIIDVADSVAVEMSAGFCPVSSPFVRPEVAAELGLADTALDELRKQLPEMVRVAEQVFA